MIRCTPDNLLREVTAARTFRDAVLTHWLEMVYEYAGAGMGPAIGSLHAMADWSPENHTFEYISLIVPSLVHTNPKFKTKSRRGGDFKEIAQAMEHGLNRWAADVRIRETLIPVTVDACMAYGVIHTSLEQYGEQQAIGGRTRPKVDRVPPRAWFMDPMALVYKAAMYQGHEYPESLERLRQEAEDPESGWDAEALANITKPNVEGKRIGRDGTRGSPPDRDEVLCTEIWVPDYQLEGYTPEDGYNGTIFTLLEGYAGSGEMEGEGFIREPRPYYGPATGPYTLMGVYTVPDQAYPLGPLQAVRGQVKILNDQVRSMYDSAARYKRILLVSAQAEKLKEALAGGEHDTVIPIPGLKADEYLVVEVGGITQQQLEARAVLRDSLDRASGISDAARGSVTGRGSATENAIANDGAATRTGYVKEQVTSAVAACAANAAWYMWHTDSVIFSLGEESANAMGAIDPVFVGGSSSVTGYTFGDLEIEIAPYSMERSNEAMLQANTLRAVEMTLNAAPVIRQFPELNWKEMWTAMGAVLNVPMESWINPEASAMLLGLQEPIVQPTPMGRLAGDRQPSGGQGGPSKPAANNRNGTNTPQPSPNSAVAGGGAPLGAMQ